MIYIHIPYTYWTCGKEFSGDIARKVSLINIWKFRLTKEGESHWWEEKEDPTWQSWLPWSSGTNETISTFCAMSQRHCILSLAHVFCRWADSFTWGTLILILFLETKFILQNPAHTLPPLWWLSWPLHSEVNYFSFGFLLYLRQTSVMNYFCTNARVSIG